MPIDLGFMVNHLPPQAYSKETLIQAYNWLRHQPAQVQELAKSPDVLVSLYSKAQIHGDAYLNRAHMQNFKTELKNLSSMMGDFETAPRASENISLQVPSESNGQAHSSSVAPQQCQSLSPQAMPQQSQPLSSPMMPQQSQTLPVQIQTQQPLPAQQNLPLDMRSLAMIQEVKNQFNLSSEIEALRLLISLGYHKVKSDL